jgi:hypothetical protein
MYQSYPPLAAHHLAVDDRTDQERDLSSENRSATMGKPATTRTSSKGLVVIPEEVRDALGLATGTSSWWWARTT